MSTASYLIPRSTRQLVKKFYRLTDTFQRIPNITLFRIGLKASIAPQRGCQWVWTHVELLEILWLTNRVTKGWSFPWHLSKELRAPCFESGRMHHSTVHAHSLRYDQDISEDDCGVQLVPASQQRSNQSYKYLKFTAGQAGW